MDSQEFMRPTVGKRFLRQPAGAPGRERPAGPAGSEKEERTPVEDPYVLCRACGQAITRGTERILVDGAHRHTFANPHGLVFEIGCFGRAPGCGGAGSASGEFTWFAGYSWRAVLCIGCLTHLGWRFAAPSGHAFFGLILERLIEPD